MLAFRFSLCPGGSSPGDLKTWVIYNGGACRLAVVLSLDKSHYSGSQRDPKSDTATTTNQSGFSLSKLIVINSQHGQTAPTVHEVGVDIFVQMFFWLRKMGYLGFQGQTLLSSHAISWVWQCPALNSSKTKPKQTAITPCASWTGVCSSAKTVNCVDSYMSIQLKICLVFYFFWLSQNG